MSNLVIVESPAKAKTIKKYLGSDYEVVASMGHVRDLPKARLSVDIKNGFAPKYDIIKGKEKLVKELKSLAEQSDNIYLATDPDREGEAISWHLAYILGLPEDYCNRVEFNEITKTGVQNGMSNPREINPQRDQHRPRKRSAGEKDTRPSCRLQAQSVHLSENPQRSLGRQSPVRRAEDHRRQRERDPQVQARGILVDRREVHSQGQQKDLCRVALFRQERQDKDQESGAGRQDRSRPQGRRLHRNKGKTRHEKEESRAAVHHFNSPAGGVEKARLSVAQNDEGRSGALRGR